MAQIILTKSGTPYLRDGGQVKRVHRGNNPLPGDGEWRKATGEPVVGERWVIEFDEGPTPMYSSVVTQIIEV